MKRPIGSGQSLVRPVGFGLLVLGVHGAVLGLLVLGVPGAVLAVGWFLGGATGLLIALVGVPLVERRLTHVRAARDKDRTPAHTPAPRLRPGPVEYHHTDAGLHAIRELLCVPVVAATSTTKDRQHPGCQS